MPNTGAAEYPSDSVRIPEMGIVAAIAAVSRAPTTTPSIVRAARGRQAGDGSGTGSWSTDTSAPNEAGGFGGEAGLSPFSRARALTGSSTTARAGSHSASTASGSKENAPAYLRIAVRA
ncbi:MAG: hypothetical protein M3545_05850 [Acidobacteriota bacterium]|nr:hypothetical protein [Acidobacteriota bacterium]